jgi:hypothetical protein
MTTRSGRNFKPQAAMTEEVDPPTHESDSVQQSPTTDLTGIVDFMRKMMREREHERRRYEEENKKRFHTMTKQMQLLERLITDRPDKKG